MTTSAKTSAKKMLMSDLMQTVGILPILILIVAVFGFITPNFFTESNLLNITRQASINIVLAAGMTFIILTGGIFPWVRSSAPQRWRRWSSPLALSSPCCRSRQR